MASAAVLLADGFEEIEAITILDVLRRAGVLVRALGVTGLSVRGAHDIVVSADALLADEAATLFDLVALPGGMPGAAHLRDDARVQALVKATIARGASVAAICAAPMALGSAGVLEGRRATCFPGFERHLRGATLSTDAVVVDGQVLTSRGPGTALAFALALVEHLNGTATSQQLAADMLVAS